MWFRRSPTLEDSVSGESYIPYSPIYSHAVSKVRKHVTIREDQEEWVDSNDFFNFSGFVRDKLDERIPECELDG